MTILDLDDRLKEECGVMGVYSPDQEAARLTFFALFALQHRGQEACGIAVSDGSKVRMYRDVGLVNQVFDAEILAELPGSVAVGHTRYSTTGGNEKKNAQPIYCQSLVGEIAVAHNGNLINANELRQELERQGEHFDSTSDSEIIATILMRKMPDGPEAAVEEVMRRARGAYSVTVLTPKFLIGFRDPSGIRPLSVATLDDGYVIASESCAFGPIGATHVRDIEPGEMVIIDAKGIRYSRGHEVEPGGMCLFEFIYFARPDSNIYGSNLYGVRERMGKKLAEEHPVEADIVVPVPDSGIPAALGFAERAKVQFREGMVKSRYIHRTFIEPDQRMRERGVRMKLTPLEEHIKDQRVILVDDSIVRGTTTKQIVRMMFDAGAKEVHVRITAPPIVHPCYYGIDMANKSELAAARMTLGELETDIGATSLRFLSIEGAVEAVQGNNRRFCLACFNGEYPIPVPEGVSKNAFEYGEIAAVSGGQLRLIQ